MIVGIDSGSTTCKAVLFNENKVMDTFSTKTGWNSKLSARECLDNLLERNAITEDKVTISATGYGREAINFADFIFTEITCHAYGGMFLMPNIQGIIDIGGQDSKVIQIQNGRVANFLMNDKCAAGTGRFLSMACETLAISIDDIDGFASLDEAIPITSMCTVFAESEIIGLLAMQKERREILSGVLNSIAQKIQQMTSKLEYTENAPLLMTGGLSRSTALINNIGRATSYEVVTHEYALFAGAIGACVCAMKKM